VRSGLAIHGEPILAPMFALVFVAARRVLGIDLYDVQLLGGLAMARGAIAEMQTGEGKTFTTLLPASLYALADPVHVVTVNDYLAGRDFESLAPVYQLLGFSVGRIHGELNEEAKQTAYACDITYGPGYEFGFDYLRDQVKLLTHRRPRMGETFRTQLDGVTFDHPQSMQRGHAVAIVDEIDSVIIDEATSPLILSTNARSPAANADVYRRAMAAARVLNVNVDYLVDEATEALRLTAQGLLRLSCEPYRAPTRGLDRPWPKYVEQALKADHNLHCDVHYVVSQDAVLIVDQNTGRIFADRSWRDGLHQAVQAKEGVMVTEEAKSIARITRQRFFRLYQKLCGMTGTAQESEHELREIYRLPVTVVPPHRPCQRTVLATRLFPDASSKEVAIVEAIVCRFRCQQPVLVGTAAIAASHRLARQLDARGIPHTLLNGVQDVEEATIVAAAGQPQAVTIATNMAGRGTDIRLGDGVLALGGLHVIATEPQESPRVDRQLSGRAARQGEPGSYQLFVAADDPLFSRHAPEMVERLKHMAVQVEQSPTDVDGVIRKVQRRAARQYAQRRREMTAHDNWLENVQRELAGQGRSK